MRKNTVRVASSSREIHLPRIHRCPRSRRRVGIYDDSDESDAAPTREKLRFTSVEMRYQKSSSRSGNHLCPPHFSLTFTSLLPLVMIQERELMPNDSHPRRRQNGINKARVSFAAAVSPSRFLPRFFRLLLDYLATIFMRQADSKI